ncbi:RNA recognition motif domain-containing protein [Foetidibacter luteolus]|uniref:RNA recognition motif domain-containing protein n=1 Tax=Foetidibacter luteolus TaxID=2608880 RepID=UPI00129A1499|nr:RNA-binding protein [Foetidibacter luteolus]
MKLFVASLPADFDDTDLKEMFELYGEITSARVVTDRQTGRSRGFGFVDMPDNEEARQTINTLDGANMRGKQLSVKEADEQQGGGGGGRGGFGNSNSGGGYNSRPPRPRRYL